MNRLEQILQQIEALAAEARAIVNGGASALPTPVHAPATVGGSKRDRVVAALRDASLRHLTDRAIGRLCGCTHPFVGRIRREMAGGNVSSSVETNGGNDSKPVETSAGNSFQSVETNAGNVSSGMEIVSKMETNPGNVSSSVETVSTRPGLAWPIDKDKGNTGQTGQGVQGGKQNSTVSTLLETRFFLGDQNSQENRDWLAAECPSLSAEVVHAETLRFLQLPNNRSPKLRGWRNTMVRAEQFAQRRNAQGTGRSPIPSPVAPAAAPERTPSASPIARPEPQDDAQRYYEEEQRKQLLRCQYSDALDSAGELAFAQMEQAESTALLLQIRAEIVSGPNAARMSGMSADALKEIVRSTAVRRLGLQICGEFDEWLAGCEQRRESACA